MEQGQIMEAEVPTVRVGATPIGLQKVTEILKNVCTFQIHC